MMNYNNKRGQAAMEFLMTYGWAILAAVIAIAVLVYFGVFSPQKLVPETCTISAPFGCSDDSTVNAGTDDITLLLTNGGGVDVVVNAGNITVDGCTASSGAIANWAAGTTETVVLACSQDYVAGDQFRGNIEITYSDVGGTREKTATGSITRKL